MRFGRRTVGAGLVLGFVATMATPAVAETRSYADPAGDVTDVEDNAVSDPRADLLDVTVRNETDVVEVEVQVAEAVDQSDEGWAELSVAVYLEEPTGASSGMLAVFGTPDGPVAFQQGPCAVDFSVDTLTDRYLLRVDDDCVRTFPRSVIPFVIVSNGDNGDYGPGDLFAEDEPMPEPVTSSSSVDVRRLAGTDRTLTAIGLSKDRFETDEAGAVVVASARSFPDALGGGPLAASANAPILLSGAEGLDARSATEMKRVLEPGGTVYVLGGTAVLSDEVVADVRAAGFTAERVAGVNRFATAVAIAEEVASVVRDRYGVIEEPGDELVFDVLLADGRTFPDALIASAAAARLGSVLLLTDGTTMPADTLRHLDDKNPYTIAIGSSARTAWPPADEVIVATTPGQLSRRVIDSMFLVGGTIAVASEDTFADALAAGGHIGGFGPLLLTDGATLDQDARVALEGVSPALREVVIYGGTAAISPAVEQSIETAVAG